MDISLKKKPSVRNYLKCLEKYSYEERVLIYKGRRVERTPLDKPEVEKRDNVKLELILDPWGNPSKKNTYRFKNCGCKLPFNFSNKLNCKYWLKIGEMNPDYLVNYRKKGFGTYEAIPVKIVKKMK